MSAVSDTRLAELAICYPLPAILDPGLDNDRRHIRYDPTGRRGSAVEATTDEQRAAKLEWLGDALLGAQVALLIQQKYAHASVQVASMLKTQTVCNEFLARLAIAYGLPSLLVPMLSDSALQRHRKVLADCLEATIAAIHLSGNGVSLQAWFSDLFGVILAESYDGVVRSLTPSPLGSNDLMAVEMDTPTHGASVALFDTKLQRIVGLASDEEPALHSRRKDPKQAIVDIYRRDKITYKLEHFQFWKSVFTVEGRAPVVTEGRSRSESDRMACLILLDEMVPSTSA